MQILYQNDPGSYLGGATQFNVITGLAQSFIAGNREATIEEVQFRFRRVGAGDAGLIDVRFFPAVPATNLPDYGASQIGSTVTYDPQTFGPSSPDWEALDVSAAGIVIPGDGGTYVAVLEFPEGTGTNSATPIVAVKPGIAPRKTP